MFKTAWETYKKLKNKCSITSKNPEIPPKKKQSRLKNYKNDKLATIM